MIKILREFLKSLFSLFEFFSGYFLTYSLRPIKSTNFSEHTATASGPKFGIVLQGPIMTESNFTLETIRIYKKIFPTTTIILSTWENEDKDVLEMIKKENIQIILNKKPNFFGQQNINLQIVSSLSGVKKAKQEDCKYVLKTRTDQRIYSPDALRLFYNLIKSFPINNKIQKERIIGLSLNTFKYRLYGLSDMNIFSQIDDALLYWDIPLDKRINPTKMSDPKENKRICEVYLTTEFMKKINRKINWSLRDSWSFFAEHTCVIDQQSIELYWRKYTKHKEYRRSQYEAERTDKQLSFAEWLEINQNFENININENILTKSFSSKI